MFTTPDVSVIAKHVSDTKGWALLVVASRHASGKRWITPFIITLEDSDLFATCPLTEMWSRQRTLILLRAKRLDKRDELLKNTVEAILKSISDKTRVLEEKETGALSGLRNLKYAAAVHNFGMDQEPAFHWMLEHDATGKAWDTLRLCRALAEKYKPHENTHDENSAVAERKLLNQKWGN
jgi:hypothetical protein